MTVKSVRKYWLWPTFPCKFFATRDLVGKFIHLFQMSRYYKKEGKKTQEFVEQGYSIRSITRECEQEKRFWEKLKETVNNKWHRGRWYWQKIPVSRPWHSWYGKRESTLDMFCLWRIRKNRWTLVALHSVRPSDSRVM